MPVIIEKVIENKYSLAPAVNIVASTTRIKEIPKLSSEYISTNLMNAKILVLQQSKKRNKYSDFFQLILWNRFLYSGLMCSRELIFFSFLIQKYTWNMPYIYSENTVCTDVQTPSIRLGHIP